MKTHAPATKSATPARSQATPKGAFFRSPETPTDQSTPFFQNALEVSQPGDKHEVEADRMADHVVESQSSTKSDSFFTPAVQREPEISRVAFESQREESLQRKEEEEAPEEKASDSDVIHRSPTNSQPPATPTLSRTRINRSSRDVSQIHQSSTSRISRRPRPGHHVTGNARINPSRARGPPSVGPSFEQTLRSTKGGGSPMSSRTRGEMESSFNADFSKVRIHTDSTAQKLNQNVQAKAFAHGQDIYFSPNRYQPESRTGKHLLAHELTHVVQQGHAIQRSPNSLSRAPPSIQRIPTSMEDVREEVNDIADNIPGYTLGTVLIGYNPILGRDVEWSASAFFRGAAGLLPGGTKLYDKLNEGGALDAAFQWIEERIQHHNLTWSRVRELWSTAWDRMGITEGISGNVRIFKSVFSGFFSDIGSFISDCIAKLTEILTALAVSAVRTLFGENGPAYDLMTMVLGKDPITDEPREWITIDFLRAAMDFFGFQSHRQKMEETGKLQEAADWLDTQFGILKGAIGGLVDGVIAIWSTFSLATLADPLALLQRIVQVVVGFIARMLEFIKNVAVKILELVKAALIALLKPRLDKIPGYPLLRVALGRDPITGEAIPRTADNFILGFLSFVPGGRERYQNLKKSGAIGKALNWLLVTIQELGLSPAAIAETFLTLWNSFSIEDLMNPLPAFARVGKTLLTFVTSVLTLVAKVALKILEFVFIGVMGPAGARVVAALKQGKNTFTKIIKNPVGFLGNLLGALGKGFVQFGSNIFKHLKVGLVGWLFGALAGSGLQLPDKFDLKGILSLVAQVLGLTYDKMRPKLVKRLGEKVVTGLEKSFEFITLFLKEGFAGVWKKFVEWIGNLKDTVMGAIKEWIVTKIVTIAVTKLATLSNPVGAVIEAILAIYNVVMFFIERMEQILAVVESVIQSITKIADGKLEDAANFVEKTMARTLPVIISFLARLIGLGGIAGKIKKVIAKIQKKVSKAIDKMISWIAKKAKALIKKGKAGLKKLFEWWKAKKKFTSKNGKSHTLHFKGKGKSAKLMVASKPMLFAEYVETLKTSGDSAADAATLTAAKKKAKEIDDLKMKTATTATTGGGSARDATPDFENKMTELAALLSKISERTTGKVATSEIKYAGLEKGYGKSATVQKLTKFHPPGSGPGVASSNWDHLAMRKHLKASFYIKGHLLNDNIGGQGKTWKNLTPLPGTLNTGVMLSQFETPAKNAVDATPAQAGRYNAISFSVVATYGRGLGPAHAHAQDIIDGKTPHASVKNDPLKKSVPFAQKIQKVVTEEKNVPQKLVCKAVAYDAHDDKTTSNPPGPTHSLFKGTGKKLSYTVKVDQDVSARSRTIGDYELTASSGPVAVAFHDYRALMSVGISDAIASKISYHIVSKNYLTGTQVNTIRAVPAKASASVGAAYRAGKVSFQNSLPTGLPAIALAHGVIDSRNVASAEFSFSGSGPLLSLTALETAIGGNPTRIAALKNGSLQLLVRRINGHRRILKPAEVILVRNALPASLLVPSATKRIQESAYQGRERADEQEADAVAHSLSRSTHSDPYRHVEEATRKTLPKVTLHHNDESARQASIFGARAFTQKNAIYFNRGEYDPASQRGQHLLAHELTHVAQQNSHKKNNPDDTMKIKSNYRRPTRRVSRRSNDGPFFQTESSQENFFTPSSEIKAKDGEEEAPKHLKTEEEEPVSAKEEEEPGTEKCSCEGKGECSKEEDEPAEKGPIQAKGDEKSESPDTSYKHCHAKTQEPFIKLAVSSAKTIADRATGASAAMALIGGLEVPGFKPTPGQLHHQKWFGKFHQRRANGIARTFGRISKALTGKIHFSCRCKKNIYAYVLPGGRRKIYLCKRFWTAGSSGFDSKPGVILHELAHEVNLSIGDKGYGTSNAEKLAKNKPRKAAHNADNFEYYAESL